MKISLLAFIVLGFSNILSGQTTTIDQNQSDNAIPFVIDSLYREDQFYIGLSFNLINNEPESFTQNGFSGGLHIGFIRDMPINKRRNKAIGVGLGWSTNVYNSNLVFTESNNTTIYEINPDRDAVESNRFHTNLIEMPIQYRWRTSTPTEFSFWRIYTGIKLGYLYSFRANFDSINGRVNVRNPDGLDRWRVFGTFTVGNGSFNAFVQYSLTPLFDNARTLTDQEINLQPIKFGIEFYLL